MDVDTPSVLKRCSSAPLINEAASSTVIPSPTTSTTPRNTNLNMFTSSEQRTRRFSASFSPSVQTVVSGPRLTPRVSQLRQEECADLGNTREVAHERELHCAMQMGVSWEELNLVANGSPASPTRGPSFSPNGVSASPTRRSYMTRRSLSPISFRPPCLSPVGRVGVAASLLNKKRTSDNDDTPSAKRCCWSDRLTPSTPGTPDSDSSDCTFRPVSPRSQPMQQSPLDNSNNEPHKAQSPS